MLDKPRGWQRVAAERARLCLLADDRALRALSERCSRRRPDYGGWAVANLGATAAILFALGVGKNTAINFSLASGLLLITSASAAAFAGLALSLATRAFPRRAPAALHA
jgi:hypothetical protein